MTPTVDQIIEMIRQLPPPEREKVRDWIEEEKLREKTGDTSKTAELNEEQNRFRLAIKWLRNNRERYLGQWVCLDGDKLIAHGTDPLQLYKDAKEKGIVVPFVEHIVEDKEYGGGIEACPQQ